MLALLLSRQARPPTPAGEHPAVGAYRPNAGPRAGEAAWPGAERAAAGRAEEPLSPELEARLRAAAHVETVPAPTPSGAPPPLPPTGPLPPELEAQRHQALIGWQRQTQQLLDDCVARPMTARRPVMLNVAFAPPVTASGPAVQELAPMAVSMPPDELRRLWRDTDPDALQGCLAQVRTLALSVSTAARSPAQVLPPAMETVLVQL